MTVLIRVLPYLEKAHRFFKAGLKVARAAVSLCIIGTLATAKMLVEVSDIIDEEDTEAPTYR